MLGEFCRSLGISQHGQGMLRQEGFVSSEAIDALDSQTIVSIGMRAGDICILRKYLATKETVQPAIDTARIPISSLLSGPPDISPQCLVPEAPSVNPVSVHGTAAAISPLIYLTPRQSSSVEIKREPSVGQSYLYNSNERWSWHLSGPPDISPQCLVPEAPSYAIIYEWQGILVLDREYRRALDREYRRAQHLHGFPWGSDLSHLELKSNLLNPVLMLYPSLQVHNANSEDKIYFLVREMGAKAPPESTGAMIIYGLNLDSVGVMGVKLATEFHTNDPNVILGFPRDITNGWKTHDMANVYTAFGVKTIQTFSTKNNVHILEMLNLARRQLMSARRQLMSARRQLMLARRQLMSARRQLMSARSAVTLLADEQYCIRTRKLATSILKPVVVFLENSVDFGIDSVKDAILTFALEAYIRNFFDGTRIRVLYPALKLVTKPGSNNRLLRAANYSFREPLDASTIPVPEDEDTLKELLTALSTARWGEILHPLFPWFKLLHLDGASTERQQELARLIMLGAISAVCDTTIHSFIYNHNRERYGELSRREVYDLLVTKPKPLCQAKRHTLHAFAKNLDSIHIEVEEGRDVTLLDDFLGSVEQFPRIDRNVYNMWATVFEQPLDEVCHLQIIGEDFLRQPECTYASYYTPLSMLSDGSNRQKNFGRMVREITGNELIAEEYRNVIDKPSKERGLQKEASLFKYYFCNTGNDNVADIGSPTPTPTQSKAGYTTL
ncbi:unnamed protein product [Owenia fusiformis]|uniref:Uncharacterized protein n=1 Tax=Owenia fusiformis TaxID=6347 RepID=A0A8S4Q3B5_OWEFU|nr:unnamed protein product [Owenia fusiformis]